MSKKSITVDDLKADAALSKIMDNLATRFGGQLPQEIADSMIDIVSWADTIPKQVDQWIQDTVSVANRVANGNANSSDFSIFWIRVHEIIESLPKYFDRYEWIIPQKDKISDPAMRKHIELGEEIRNLLTALKGALSDDETITLEYERHCNAHIFQNGYRTHVKVEGDKIKDAKTDYKGKSKKEVNEIISRELAKYNYIDADFLKAILKRIEPQLSGIAGKIRAWSS